MNSYGDFARIRTGIGAYQVLHSLNKVNDQLAEVHARTATGKRVVGAENDPAGYITGTRLGARSRGLAVALDNLGQAQTIVDTADGGAGCIAEAVFRLREVATQAASDTLGDEERGALQEEINGILTYIDRTAWDTAYNGIALLAQTHVDIGFVFDVSSTMSQERNTLLAEAASFSQEFVDHGMDAEFGLASYRDNLDAGDGVVMNSDIGAGQPAFVAALSGLGFSSGLVDAYSALVNTSGVDDFNGDGDAFAWRQDVPPHLILVTDTHREYDAIPGTETQNDVANQLAAAGVTVHVIGDPSDSGVYSTITSQTGGGFYDIGDPSGSGIPSALDQIAGAITMGQISRAVDDITMQVGPDNTDQVELGLPKDATVFGLGLSGLSVTTRQNAEIAMGRVDNASAALSEIRSEIGAKAQRLSAKERFLTRQFTNTEAGKSRIVDADLAKERVNSITLQILQQTTIGTLAQANMRTQAVLGLLSSTWGHRAR